MQRRNCITHPKFTPPSPRCHPIAYNTHGTLSVNVARFPSVLVPLVASSPPFRMPTSPSTNLFSYRFGGGPLPVIRMRIYDLLFGSFKFLVPLAGCVYVHVISYGVGPHSKIIVVLPLLLRAAIHSPNANAHQCRVCCWCCCCWSRLQRKTQSNSPHQLTHSICTQLLHSKPAKTK